jgi:hypothetical protein
MKKFRKLSVILLVFVFIVGGLIYALTSGEGIESKEKLANVNGTTNVEVLKKELVKNVNVEQYRRLTSTINLNDQKFQALLKNSIDKNSVLLEGSYKIKRNHINAKLPIKLLGLNTILYSNISVAGEGNSLTLTLENAKAGELPVPNFVLEKYLKESLQGTDAEVKGNVITFNSLPFKLDGVYVSINDEVVGKVSFTSEELLKLIR